MHTVLYIIFTMCMLFSKVQAHTKFACSSLLSYHTTTVLLLAITPKLRRQSMFVLFSKQTRVTVAVKS